ncbi:hypothetical protein LTR85_002583 [Meristemomyces frigidus]|nr:hypothetical protein LTR85_002583 [Meristemomyces frigidus]
MADIQTNLFINGEYVPSSSGKTLSIYSPNDESLVTDKVQVASESDVDKAVAAAKAAFPAWRDTSGAKRAAIMMKFADLLEKYVDKLASLESRAMGQPISLAKLFVLGPAAYWRYYAGYAGKVAGESFPPNEDGTYKIVQYEPLGVCAGICAWNGSHTLAAWKMAPAMATGNTFILKSSEKSPLSLAAYGDLINEAGFPPGVINVVTGAGAVGSLLASHMQIAKIAFTGSAFAGRAVMAAAAKSNLKHVSLELGGKSPALIFDDADLDNAVEHSSTSFLRNSGQICFAASRVLVQEGIASKFIEAIKTAFENANQKMGDPSLQDTLFGPLADKKQFERVMGFLNDGKAEGVQYLTGGERKGDKGTFVQPTVILNPDLKSKVYTDEIFGPVISVKTFKTEDEAIEMANNTSYGLGSTVYTSDIARALRVAGKIEAGTVGINAAFSTSPQTPFGGFKQSGYGRESGAEGLKEYLQPKTIHINMNVPAKKGQSEKIKFRSIGESAGGTFRFRNPGTDVLEADPEDPELIHYIGTTGVRTCVGVYFNLSDNSCFVAHINAIIRDVKGNATRICADEEEGVKIKEAIILKLQQEASSIPWAPADPAIESSLIIVCPMPDTPMAIVNIGDEPAKQTGWWIVEGIKEFLRLPNAWSERKAGFIVDHRNGHSQMLTHDGLAASRGVDPPERSMGEWLVSVSR